MYGNRFRVGFKGNGGYGGVWTRKPKSLDFIVNAFEYRLHGYMPKLVKSRVLTPANCRTSNIVRDKPVIGAAATVRCDVFSWRLLRRVISPLIKRRQPSSKPAAIMFILSFTLNADTCHDRDTEYSYYSYSFT